MQKYFSGSNPALPPNTVVLKLTPRMYMRGRDEKGALHLELDDGSQVTALDMIKTHGGFLLSKTRGGTIGGSWDKFTEVSGLIFDHLDRAGLKSR